MIFLEEQLGRATTMSKTISLIILACLVLSAEVMAADSQFKYVMCRNKQIVRTIRVEWNKDTSSCQTWYTKSGVDRSVGNGKFFESCVNFLNNVQGNLEKAGWKCKDISKASISQSKKSDDE